MTEITTKNICLFGDSITYGAWEYGEGWADRLRHTLHEKTRSSAFSQYYWVYNLGIPGNTSDELLRRFNAELAAREPHSIVFAIGINDSSRRINSTAERVPIERFRKNFASLLDEALATNATVICVGLTPVDEKKTVPFNNEVYFSNAAIQQYDAVITEESKKRDVQKVAIWHLFDPTTDLSDGLHPNEYGHEKIHDAVLNAICALPAREILPVVERLDIL